MRVLNRKNKELKSRKAAFTDILRIQEECLGRTFPENGLELLEKVTTEDQIAIMLAVMLSDKGLDKAWADRSLDREWDNLIDTIPWAEKSKFAW